MTGRPSYIPHGATLRELVRELPGATVLGDDGVFVGDVRHDSRDVRPGDLFVARRGQKSDGAQFVRDAIARGAVAVASAVPVELPVPVVLTQDPERALAVMSSAVWAHPTWSLDVLGVTGTNGKTTTTWLLEHALTELGVAVGLIGTVAQRFGGRSWPAVHTTPESDDLARRFAAMREDGATHVAMEVSSHALALQRVASVRFRAAAFTNLTQDHLDLHGTMESYVAAKRSLFADLSPASMVFNADDATGRAFAAEWPRALTFSASGAPATLRCASGGAHAEGIDAVIETPDGEVSLRSPLRGAHNVENLLCAMGVLVCLDVPAVRAAGSLAGALGAPGRLERVTPTEGDIGFDVLVDYAHSPDALERVLATLRRTTRGRIICLFGCGGDRDRSKRPRMGEAVARGADVAVLTTDNPRSEEPAQIAADAEAGLRAGGAVPARNDVANGSYLVVLDRREAIERALTLAQDGDVVLLAGKGHETYQERHGVRAPFDDRAAARAFLDGSSRSKQKR